MRTVQKRTCTGLSLTAAYWSEPDEADSEADPELAARLAAGVTAALSVRCGHPVYLPRMRGRVRARRS